MVCIRHNLPCTGVKMNTLARSGKMKIWAHTQLVLSGTCDYVTES